LAPGWQQIPELKNNASWGYLYDTDGHGMFRPPGYPAVWAGLILLHLDDRRSQEAVVAVVDGITTVILFCAAWRMFGRVAAICAATLCAFNPFMCWYTTTMAREPYMTLLLLIGTLLLWRGVQRKSLPWTVAAGIVFAAGG